MRAKLVKPVFRTPAKTQIKRAAIFTAAFFFLKLGVEGILNNAYSQGRKAKAQNEQPVPQQAMQANQVKADTAAVMARFAEEFNAGNLKYLGSFSIALPESLPQNSPLLQICDRLSITQNALSSLKGETGRKGPLRFRGETFYLIYDKKNLLLHIAVLQQNENAPQ